MEEWTVRLEMDDDWNPVFGKHPHLKYPLLQVAKKKTPYHPVIQGGKFEVSHHAR